MKNKIDFLKLCLRIAKKEKIDFDTIETDDNACFFYLNDKITNYFILNIQENKYIPFYKNYCIEWTQVALNKITQCDQNNLMSIYGIKNDQTYNISEYF